ncbi:MAG: universal stress protein [Bacteroidetes bacterium]|jgi:nucleotide-binding universal stress UspA family protein|nr:universal stress protein [Bacteroidota bacterium]
MIKFNHWLACLDLSKMDEILVGYSSFLSSVEEPKTITFLHVIESGPTAMGIIDQFPEIETKEEFEEIIRNELNEKIDEHFSDSSIETRLIIKEGKPTDQIIQVVNSLEPDLLLMGKKVGYAGEGVIPKRILKYVPTSLLFIPENCRYNLENILVPVDFSEQSAKGLETARELVQNGTITAQHIYEYRAQFFPYMLSEEEKQQIDQEISKKKDTFIEEYEIPGDVNFVLSQRKQGRLADIVYGQSISQQSDMIIVGSKIKKLPNLIRHDFTDKMVGYAFGIPLLIQKNKEKYTKFLKSIFKD